MSLALAPCVLVGLLALCIAGSRVYVLAWQAPVAVAPLTAALTRHVACGELAQARALCRALQGSWAADCARRVLDATDEHARVRAQLEELQGLYRQRAQAGLFALQALGRMAFPLALGIAIAVMSGAFVDADVPRVEEALSTALQCLTVAVMNIVFCRVSAGIVKRQADARLREIGAVCRALIPPLGAARPAEKPAPALP